MGPTSQARRGRPMIQHGETPVTERIEGTIRSGVTNGYVVLEDGTRLGIPGDLS